jgi:hypothetical protein
MRNLAILPGTVEILRVEIGSASEHRGRPGCALRPSRSGRAASRESALPRAGTSGLEVHHYDPVRSAVVHEGMFGLERLQLRVVEGLRFGVEDEGEDLQVHRCSVRPWACIVVRFGLLRARREAYAPVMLRFSAGRGSE